MPKSTKRPTPITSQHGEPRPKLPHERDESTDDPKAAGALQDLADKTDSAAASMGRDKMRKAHDDLAGGRQDTDRGPVADATYQKVRKLPK